MLIKSHEFFCFPRKKINPSGKKINLLGEPPKDLSSK